MRKKTRDALLPIALLAGASGARTGVGLAAIRSRRRAKYLAAAEFVADKLPSAPDRVSPALLFGRVAAGALVGAIVGGRTGANRAEAALIGGAVAFASTHATFRMRRALSRRLPPLAAAFVEDAIVVGAASAGAAMLRSEGYRVPLHQRRFLGLV